jgi:proteasome accessory factor B
MEFHERLLDLVSFLLAARHPVSATEIYGAFPQDYAGTPQARERKFSRDKERLRELGIAIVHTPPDEEHEEGGYSIDRSAFFLPDIALTPEERAALYAVGAAALQAALPLRSELSHALTKLRASSASGEERALPIILSQGERRTDVEDLMTHAVARRQRLKLRYAGEPRERAVDPYVFSLRRNRFSLVGYCHLRRGIRTFHAERVLACRLENADAGGPDFDVPAGFDPTPHLPVHPWQMRLHAPLPVTLTFPPELAESGPRSLGVEPGEPIPATNLNGLLAEVLALGEGIRIVAPPEARDRMSAMLEALRQRLGEAA